MRSISKERDFCYVHRMQSAAGDVWDSHPRWCSFPPGSHLRPNWRTISQIQFKLTSFDFNVEQFRIHSPLLRGSYLVLFHLRTYMLKFSRFTNHFPVSRISTSTHAHTASPRTRIQLKPKYITQTTCLFPFLPAMSAPYGIQMRQKCWTR